MKCRPSLELGRVLSRDVLACAMLATALTGTSATADTIHVPKDFPTIQSAIDAASDGDEVVVAPGTYAEAIDFQGKAITVGSESGAQATTIDASTINGAVSVVTFVNGEDPSSTLDGFTITGGNGTLINSRQRGGGVLIIASSPAISNCVLVDSNSEGGGGAYISGGGSPTFTDCTFVNNAATLSFPSSGGGAMVDASSPGFYNCTFEANECSFDGGALFLYASTAEVAGCIFVRNAASETIGWGGAIKTYGGASADHIRDCVFVGNSGHGGGAINNHDFAAPTIVNCLFIGNYATWCGGAILNHSDGHPVIVNASMVSNAAGNGGALCSGFSNWAGSVTNSIMWNNSPNEIAPSTPVTVQNSTIEGGYAGDGNIDIDPMFIAVPDPGADGIWGTDDDDLGNLRLADRSAAIDAGNNDAIPSGIETDLDGNPRIVDGDEDGDAVVDMGAYEFQPGLPGDLDGDGIVDGADLAILLGAWGPCADCDVCDADLDGDCTVDGADLAVLLGNWG